MGWLPGFEALMPPILKWAKLEVPFNNRSCALEPADLLLELDHDPAAPLMQSVSVEWLRPDTTACGVCPA